jgi:predicted nuclease with TOPRIM domain
MEILKLENNRITISKPITSYEEKTYDVSSIDKQIAKLREEFARRLDKANEIKRALDELLEIQTYVKEKSDSNKLG